MGDAIVTEGGVAVARQGTMTSIAAAVIVKDGKILICQRKADREFPFKWEFPGGKIEKGEETTAALRRELKEELDIEAEIGPEIARFGYNYPKKPKIMLIFFKVERFEGQLTNKDFAQIRWVFPKQLGVYDLLEADFLILDKLQAF
jgi:8-oxo-dGTP diphosphatase